MSERSLPTAAEILAEPCPTCPAESGKPCLAPGNLMAIEPHASRRRAARLRKEAEAAA